MQIYDIIFSKFIPALGCGQEFATIESNKLKKATPRNTRNPASATHETDSSAAPWQDYSPSHSIVESVVPVFCLALAGAKATASINVHYATCVKNLEQHTLAGVPI